MNTLAVFLAASGLVRSDIKSFLVTLLVVIVICAIVAFLVNRAPFIEASWKPFIQWILIAIPVVYLLFFLLSFL